MFLAPTVFCAAPSEWWHAKQDSSEYSGHTSFLSKRSPFARQTRRSMDARSCTAWPALQSRTPTHAAIFRRAGPGADSRGCFPVARHHRGKRIQFEIKIGVAGGDHFVIDKFLTGAQVAFAGISPCDELRCACPCIPQRDGFFVRANRASVCGPSQPRPDRGSFRSRPLRRFRNGRPRCSGVV